MAMDFSQVWEDYYDIPLENFRGPCVWRFMSAFLLSIQGKTISTAGINSFIFQDKKLGSKNSGHFMCELLPLPKKSKDSIADYQFIWSSIEKYRSEVMPKRFELILSTIENNEGIRTIISYEKLLNKSACTFNYYITKNTGFVLFTFSCALTCDSSEYYCISESITA